MYFVYSITEVLFAKISENIIAAFSAKKVVKCGGLVDIIFLLDSSTSVGPENWKLQLKFLADLTRPLNIARTGGARVALATFNTEPQVIFDFDRYPSSKALRKGIRKTKFTEGLTFTGEALKLVLTNLVPKMRRTVPKLLFLVTDGQSNGSRNPVKFANKIKEAGVNIFTIGISDRINR